MKRFQVAVFGKQGCEKCEVLKKRLNKILEEKEFSGFESSYYDLGTVDGLVRFCQCEILNPQRIPSFMVYEYHAGEGGAKTIPVRQVRKISERDSVETFLALETNYGSTGVITPQDIRQVLDIARQMISAEV